MLKDRLAVEATRNVYGPINNESFCFPLYAYKSGSGVMAGCPSVSDFASTSAFSYSLLWMTGVQCKRSCEIYKISGIFTSENSGLLPSVIRVLKCFPVELGTLFHKALKHSVKIAYKSEYMRLQLNVCPVE